MTKTYIISQVTKAPRSVTITIDKKTNKKKIIVKQLKLQNLINYK